MTNVGPDRELTSRVTALITPQEWASVEILRRIDGRTASAYIRRLIQSDMAEALKEKRLTEETLKAEVKKAEKAKGK